MSVLGSSGATRSADRRKLVAIMYADMVGYSRLIGMDDQGTLDRLRALRRDVIDPAIAGHGGSLVQTGGDSLLVVFDSIDRAVRCAVKVQEQVPIHDADQPPDRAIRFRVGMNIGDAIADGTDLHGDAVNVAARLQAECPPGGICVSRSVRDHVHGRLRLEFEELGWLTLKNISRPVEAFSVRLEASVPKSVERSFVDNTREPLPLPGKPSIAVLAFTDMSGDLNQEYFSDGIADDIITELSRSRSLFVIARNSSFTYKGRAVDVKHVARELGVRYVVEGSVRRSGSRIRVTAQLIDAETGNHIWAERYDRTLEDVFAVQDEITRAVAVAIEPEVAEMERQRAIRKPPASLSAWEAYQSGLWHMARIGDAENEAAKEFFQRAIGLDPNFAPAYAWLAYVIRYEAVLYQSRAITEALDEAYPIAERAVSLDPSDAIARTSMATSRLLRGDHAGALAEARHALTVSPNVAAGHSVLGLTLVFCGQPRAGIESLLEGRRLDPHDPMRYMRLLYIAIAHYFLREYDAAVLAAEAAIRYYPDHPLACRWLAAALGQAGRLDEAKAALQKAIANNRRSFEMYACRRVPWYRVEDFERLLDGLRRAGWQS